MEFLILLLALIFGRGLIKAIFSSINSTAPAILNNTGKGLENLSNAAPSLGAYGGMEGVAFANSGVEALKQQVGCVDDKVKTMTQLQDWMKANNMF